MTKFRLLLVFLILISGMQVFAQEQADPRSRAVFQIKIAEVMDTNNHPVTDIRKYGAVGNGTVDDTKAIQSAIDSSRFGSEIQFPEGNYLITSPIVVRKSKLTLSGNNAVIIFKPSFAQEISFSILKKGKAARSKALPAAFMVMGEMEPQNSYDIEKVIAGSMFIQLKGNTADLSEGDLIVIAGGDHGKVVNRKKSDLSYYREQNFITRITKKTGNTLNVEDAISIPFDPDNSPRIFKLIPVRNIHIEGFQINIGNSAALLSGITFAFAEESFVRNCSVKNTSKFGIGLSYCYHCEISGNSVADSTAFEGGEGYGIALERSHFCVVRNNTLSNHRHGIVLDHGNGNCLIERNQVDFSKTSASIDIHGEYNYFNTVRSNTINHGKTGIVIGGGGDVHYNDGPYNAIIENSINNCEVGIEVRNESASTIIGKNSFKNIRKKEIEYTNMDDGGIIHL